MLNKIFNRLFFFKKKSIPFDDSSFSLRSDKSSKEDYLGFKPYVEAISNFVSDPHTEAPITLSIEGDWGSGKTSFLDQLRTKLELKSKDDKRKFYSVWFNPWRCPEGEALWASFALEYEKQLREQAGANAELRVLWKSLKKRELSLFLLIVVSFSNLFSTYVWPWIKSFFNFNVLSEEVFLAFTAWSGFMVVINFLLNVIVRVWKITKEVNAPSLAKGEVSYLDKIPFISSFHKDLDFLTTNLVNKERVYVFIDDLDRCEPDRAVELLKSINLMVTEKSNTVFILGLDRHKISQGLAFSLKDYIEFTESYVSPEAYGYEFIDKLIQVPFQLPSVSPNNVSNYIEQLIKGSDYLGREMADSSEDASMTSEAYLVKPDVQPPRMSRAYYFENHSDDIREVVSVVAPFFNNNPRKIKKFLNILRLQIFIGNQTGLFGFVDEEDSNKCSIYQLGKFLACLYRYPKFVHVWTKFNNLVLDLNQFHQCLNSQALHSLSSSPLDERWNSLKVVRKLDNSQFKFYKTFITKCLEDTDLCAFLQDEECRDDKSLLNFPINKVLSVCPVFEYSDLAKVSQEDLFFDSEKGLFDSKEGSFDGMVNESSNIDAEEKLEIDGKLIEHIQSELNARRDPNEPRYILDGVVAMMAYEAYQEGKSIDAIKGAIDLFLNEINT